MRSKTQKLSVDACDTEGQQICNVCSQRIAGFVGHLPFTIIESTDDHCVPEWVHFTPAVVHYTGQPGVYGLGAVTVAIS